MSSFSTVEETLEHYIPKDELAEVKRILYGRPDDCKLEIPKEAQRIADENDFDIKAYQFTAKPEDTRKPRIVRIAAAQTAIVRPTTDPIHLQLEAIHARMTKVIEAAAAANVNVIGFQELWTMPFVFCTREKHPWCQFAEDAEHGPTTKLMKQLAARYNMVIVSSILERDEARGDVIWNATVVISNTGKYLGKHRKNHIPRFHDCNESSYYMEGNTGHPVFDTQFGKIGVVICFGRHFPTNWQMFGLNGAEIVFDPCAETVGPAEAMWGIEARSAAIQNSYFTVAINRVGTEVYPNEFTSGDGQPAHKELGPYYGSSYIAAPGGARTPGLSRSRDGLLIAETDLNLCRQVRDQYSLGMTQRLPLYAESFTKASQLDYEPQIIREK